MRYREITPDSADWPVAVNDVPDPPERLWIAGRDPRWHDGHVALVGARAATAYGKQVTRDLAVELGDAGVSVVSGLAHGVDGQAHTGALAAQAMTVAVLPCGIDFAYPADHTTLRDRIAHCGVLVSEYPPGTTPIRTRFLDRNRLIAALSSVLVVVEAGHRSGSLNAARHANELDRAVCAVPGSVTSAMSAGSHELIRSGQARLVASADHVRDALRERAAR